MEFKPGLVVEMKSGGQPMTVLDIGRYTGLIWCRWIINDKVNEAPFFSDMIKVSSRGLLRDRPLRELPAETHAD